MARTIPFFQFFKKKPILADENRTSFRDQQWKGIRSKVILQMTAGGIAYMLWFLTCLSYVYGTLYRSPSRHAAFHVLAVDYDGGVVGQALEAAYTQLKGPGFFTLKYRSREEYPTEEDLYQAVWHGDYWAAISTTAGASDRLSAALQGGNAAATYDPLDALHYVWNQQYYTVFTNTVILNHMNQLVDGTRLAYNKINGTQASRVLNETDSAAVQTFLNPIQAASRDIMTAAFGSIILMNTVSMAMPVLQQFFFLLVLNGVLGAHQLYKKMTVRSSLLFRRAAGVLFTFGAALCQTGYYWAFRENWGVNGNQFVLTWMTFWLLMHIHLLILDSISTVAPLPVMPFIVLLWVLLNTAGTLSPLEAQADFYHWMVALPSHEAYSVLVTIWTGGAHNRLHRALPILFAWWLVANATTSLTHIRACHLAYKLDQHDQTTAAGVGKDKEEEITLREKKNDCAALENAMTWTATITMQRIMEDVALEQRQVYGPSIPPFA